MRSLWLRLIAGSALIVIAGCGGSSRPQTPPPPQAVTFTFTNGTPTAAAVQTSGAFTSASLTGNQLSLTLPTGTTKFAVAYVCPPIVLPGLTTNNEFVVEATMQDGPAFTASCAGIPAASAVSGSVNPSLIPGTSDVRITGRQGFSTSVGTSGLAFNVTLPTGTNDVATVAVDGSNNALAVRMLRSQTVPLALNGGGTIFLAPSDATTNQTVTVNGVPIGFAAPTTFVDYQTANGTLIVLYNGPATLYRAVPAAIAQSGDFYFYDTGSSDVATHNSTIGFLQSTTTGGGAITHTMPPQWSIFSPPAAATFPTFTFNYAGFSGLSGVADQAAITWFSTLSTVSSITVTATASFQGGVTTLAVPNLTALPGFLPSAASSTSVSWVARTFGGTGPSLSFLLNVQPSNGSASFVQNQGSYIEP